MPPKATRSWRRAAYLLTTTPSSMPSSHTGTVATAGSDATRLDSVDRADPEVGAGQDEAYLYNDSISSYTWNNLNVIVKDRSSKQDRKILDGVTGVAKAGEMLALMGPSGSGKTTLLNFLAQRASAASLRTEGELLVDGAVRKGSDFKAISSYVEQEDALIGSLTVRETIDFAARMASTRISSKAVRQRIVDKLIASFGLSTAANTIIGTPIKKGISGGQKRRVSVASQLITGPKLLFLDEPTSGLDSTASYETMNFVKEVARKFKLIVIVSIHQPSTSTFNLFDGLALLSQGKLCYQGPVGAPLADYMSSIGFSIPAYTNPAEYLLDLVNADFSESARQNVGTIQAKWQESSLANQVVKTKNEMINQGRADAEHDPTGQAHKKNGKKSMGSQVHMLVTLMHRSFIKSYRDITVYGVRIAMYTGLAILMGTVWLRLDSTQESIQPFVNAIFFGSAFMSFMAVAYVPAYLEDRAVYVKDRSNGLYGPSLFMVTNFLVGLPYLFAITLAFSLITYWLTGFRNTATAFFTFVMWIFFDLLAAESMVVFLASVFPNAVVALVLIAFANGLWMSVGGFLVPLTILNAWWRYAWSPWDYQAIAFRGLLINEFTGRTYSCPIVGGTCSCNYPTSLECEVPGTAVLQSYGYGSAELGKYVGIMLSIIAGYRLLGWFMVWLRKT